MKNKKIYINTVWLMLFQIAKIVFPFITLPFLTRVLTVGDYGVVSYTKNIMSYLQIFVDFGFVLSATKNIVKYSADRKQLNYIIGNTMLARTMLGIVGFIITFILCFSLPILRSNILYTMLSYVAVFESIFLMDFLFRGLEKMHIIAIRFIVMKLFSTVFTFILVKNSQTMIFIPILDILSTLIAIMLVFIEFKKLDIKVSFSGFDKVIDAIKDSFIYFLSNVASTSFNALSTIIIGILLGTTEVAYWSVCMQITGSITACYNPITDSIYPEMIKTKNMGLIKKTISIFMPIVIFGCIICYFFSGMAMQIIGGSKYLVAVPVFRGLIPTLFFGFLSILFGWPTLGAINKTKETTLSTVLSIFIHIFILICLIITNRFTLLNIAFARSVTEASLFMIRYMYYRKFEKLFIKN